MHGIHGGHEDAMVGVALRLAHVRVGARWLVDGHVGAAFRLEVGLGCIVEDPADALLSEPSQRRRDGLGSLAGHKVGEHRVPKQGLGGFTPEHPIAQREQWLGMFDEPRLRAGREHGGATEQLKGGVAGECKLRIGAVESLARRAAERHSGQAASTVCECRKVAHRSEMGFREPITLAHLEGGGGPWVLTRNASSRRPGLTRMITPAIDVVLPWFCQ